MGERGLEPRTSVLSGLRSNQLSYTPLLSNQRPNFITTPAPLSNDTPILYVLMDPVQRRSERPPAIIEHLFYTRTLEPGRNLCYCMTHHR